MPRKGSKQLYKPKVEYKYTVKDIAELAGMTRNAVGVAKAHGKVDPADFKSAVSFLVRRILINALVEISLVLQGGPEKELGTAKEARG